MKNPGRARNWLRLRDAIRRTAKSSDRERLLRRFGEEIRALMPDVMKAAMIGEDEAARANDTATAQGVLIGAWLQLDPMNPTWPGRDRLYVIRREDLVNTCAILSTLGFFPQEEVAGVVEQVDTEGRKAFIPGLESPGVPAGEIPALLWESAVESARSKKRWREQCVGAGAGNALWADASWRDSPAVWRSCALFDAADPVTEECRVLPATGGDAPAGLVAIVKTPRGDAEDLADRWRESGWTVATVSRDDSIGLYETLTEADMEQPLAVVLTIGAVVSARLHVSRTAIRRREEGLLGEMSDDQFSEVMGEFLGGE